MNCCSSCSYIPNSDLLVDQINEFELTCNTNCNKIELDYSLFADNFNFDSGGTFSIRSIYIDNRRDISDIIDIYFNISERVPHFIQYPWSICKHLLKLEKTTNYTIIHFPDNFFPTRDIHFSDINKIVIGFKYKTIMDGWFDYRVHVITKLYNYSIHRHLYIPSTISDDWYQSNKYYENKRVSSQLLRYDGIHRNITGFFIKTNAIMNWFKLRANSETLMKYDMNSIFEHLYIHSHIQQICNTVKHIFKEKYHLDDYLIEHIINFIDDPNIYWFPCIPMTNWDNDDPKRSIPLLDDDHDLSVDITPDINKTYELIPIYLSDINII